MAGNKRGYSTFFEVQVTPGKKQKPNDEPEVLILAPFNKYPKICFENVIVKTSSTAVIILRNPTSSEINIELQTLPDTTRGFVWSATEFVIPAGKEDRLQICWTPNGVGKWRETIKVFDKNKYKTISEFIIISSANEAKKVQKRNARGHALRNRNVLKQNNSSSVTEIKQSKPIPENLVPLSERNENKENIAGESIYPVLDVVYPTFQSAIQDKTFSIYDLNDVDEDERRSTYVVPPTLSTLASLGAQISDDFSTDVINFKIEHEDSLRKSPAQEKFDDSLEEPSVSTVKNGNVEIVYDNVENKNVFSAIDELNFSAFSGSSDAIEIVLDSPKEPILISDNSSLNSPDIVGGDSYTLNEEGIKSTNTETTSMHCLNSRFNMIDNLVLSSEVGNQCEVPMTNIRNLDKSKSNSLIPIATDLFKIKETVKLHTESELAQHIENHASVHSCSTPLQIVKSSKNYSFDLSKNSEGTDIEKEARFLLGSPLSENSKIPKKFTVGTDIGSSKLAMTPFDSRFNFIDNLFMSPVVEDQLEQCMNKNKDKLQILSRSSQIEQNEEVDQSQINLDLSYPNNSEQASSTDLNPNNQKRNIFPELSQPLTSSSNLLIKHNDNSILKEEEIKFFPESKICKSISGNLSNQNLPILPSLEYNLKENIHITPISNRKSHCINTLCQKNDSESDFLSENESNNRTFLKLKSSSSELLSPNTDDVFVSPKTFPKRSTVKQNIEKSHVFELGVAEVLTISPPKQRKLSNIVQKLSPMITSRRSIPNRQQPQRLLNVRKVPLEIKEASSEKKVRIKTEARSTGKRRVMSGPIRLPMKKLKLSFKTPTVDKPGHDQTPDDFIRKISNPEPFFVYTTLDPFLAGHLYYDEEWLAEQEKDLIQWVNSILSPPLELEACEIKDVPSTAHILDQSSQVQHRLNCLRRAATAILLQASTVLSKVRVAVDKRYIAVRDDKDLHFDLGLQAKVTDLLLCYNPLWLRIGLEAIYGREIPLRSNSDRAGLTNFIRKNVLSDDYIKAQYSHPTVPHLMLPGFEIKMKKFTLYKFLMLIYIMDLAKTKQLILHNPCLFCKNSPFKSSRDILIEFSKCFLSGISNITIHLKYLQYEVTHKQTYLDEYDFSLNCRGELRDGVRLTRLAEMIVDSRNLCSQLRVPAISNLQKKHNVKVALTALNNAGYEFSSDITVKDIVDGHREKTLSLIWQLRSIIQKRAIHLILFKWRETKQLRNDRKGFLKKRYSAIKIQQYYRNFRIMKLERSRFLQLKLAAIKIQNYWRSYCLLKTERSKYLQAKPSAIKIQKFYISYRIMKLDHSRFLKLKSSAIKIQKYYRRYLANKLERINFLRKKSAILIIQRCFRNYMTRKNEKLTFITQESAAIVLQRCWRNHAAVKTDRSEFLKIKSSVLKIQCYYRSYKLMRSERSRFLTMKLAAIKVQSFYKSYLTMKVNQYMFLRKKSAVTTIQKFVKGYLQMKMDRLSFIRKKSAAIILQRCWRSYAAMKVERIKYQHMKASSIKIQRYYRNFRIMKLEHSRFVQLKSAAIKIQSYWRSYSILKIERSKYLQAKACAIKIQKYYRSYRIMKFEHSRFFQLKSSVIKIQKYYRHYLAIKLERINFLRKKSAIIIIQRCFRNYMTRKNEKLIFINQESAAIVLQRCWRNHTAVKTDRSKFLKIKSSVLKIQCYYRSYKIMRSERSRFLTMKLAAIKIQSFYKSYLTMKVNHYMFLRKKSAVTTIQKFVKGYLQMKTDRLSYIRKKSAAIILQRYWRSYAAMKVERIKYQNMKASSIKIQHYYKSFRIMKLEHSRFLQLKSAAIKIQSYWRSYSILKTERSNYLQAKASAIKIQKYYRSYRIMKLDHSRYLQLKLDTIKIQRYWRRYCILKTEQSKYLEAKVSAIKIQKYYRRYRVMKLEHSRFLQLKLATTKIQRYWRRYCISKTEKSKYLQAKASAIKIQKYYRRYRVMKLEHSRFSQLNLATIKIQRYWRSYCILKIERSKYLQAKASAIKIQKYYRWYRIMNLEHSRFLQWKSATIKIQRYWRNYIILKTERSKYIQAKASAIKIQKYYRSYRIMKLEHSQFLQLKSAVIKVQAYWRNYNILKTERSKYLQAKTSAIKIQKYYRGYRTMKLEHSRFFQLKSSVIKIQKYYRCYLATKLERINFLRKKSAILIIQRCFRNYMTRKKEKLTFITQESAAIVLQRCWRNHAAVKTDRSEFLKIKSSVLKIQYYYRSYKLMRSERSRFLTMKLAATKIQSFYKSYITMKVNQYMFLRKKSAVKSNQKFDKGNLKMNKDRLNFIRMKSAATILQRFWRSYAAMKVECFKYQQMKASSIKIQQYYRGYKIMKTDHSRFCMMKSSAIKIQKYYRDYRTIKLYRLRFLIVRTAAIVIQAVFRGFIARKRYLEKIAEHNQLQVTHRAASKIQAFWRGYKSRKTSQLRKEQKKLCQFKKSDNSHRSLRQRFNEAVHILKHNIKIINLHPVINCLVTLDIVTSLSSQFCDELVAQGLVKNIYNVIYVTHSRSQGDVLTTESAIMVLINVYKHKHTATSLWKTTVEENGIRALVEFMMNSYSKNPKIFCNAATLLWLFAENKENIEIIKTTPKVLQMLNYVSKESKKKRKMVPVKKENHIIPDTKPHWGNYFNKSKTFVDKDFALEKLLEKLEVKK